MNKKRHKMMARSTERCLWRAHGEAVSFTREAIRTRHEFESAMLALDAALEQEEGK